MAGQLSRGRRCHPEQRTEIGLLKGENYFAPSTPVLGKAHNNISIVTILVAYLNSSRPFPTTYNLLRFIIITVGAYAYTRSNETGHSYEDLSRSDEPT